MSRLKTSLKNEERKLEDLNKLTKQLQEERGQVVDIIRQEFADRYVANCSCCVHTPGGNSG